MKGDSANCGSVLLLDRTCEMHTCEAGKLASKGEGGAYKLTVDAFKQANQRMRDYSPELHDILCTLVKKPQ